MARYFMEIKWERGETAAPNEVLIAEEMFRAERATADGRRFGKVVGVTFEGEWMMAPGGATATRVVAVDCE